MTSQLAFYFIGVCFGQSILEHIEHDVCRTSPDALWFYDVTPDACYKNCRTRPNCISVNMHTEAKTCFLNFDSGNEKGPCQGYLYSEKKDWDSKLNNRNKWNPCLYTHISVNTKDITTRCSHCHVTQSCVPDDNDVICTYTECANPTPVQNGRILGNQRFVGARIVIKCIHNYVPSGPTSLTCHNNGLWASDVTNGIAEMPRCLTECPTLPSIAFATLDSNRRLQGSTVTYICDDGYILIGPANLTCLSDGTWTHGVNVNQNILTTLPYCEAACDRPPDVDHAVRTGDRFVNGSEVIYTCQGSYKLVGPATFRCNNHTWLATDNCAWNSNNEDDLMTSPPRCIQEECIVKNEEDYVIFQQEATWMNAANICAANGGHLVSFSCEDEFLFVKEIIEATEYSTIYIGLNDIERECYWTWYNSTDEVTFQPWSSGEPNNHGGVEDCATLSRDRGSLLNDVNCDRTFWFICELNNRPVIAFDDDMG